MYHEEITIGQTDYFEKTISEYDVYTFAGITGDLNPYHINEEFCKKTRFKKRIVHGIYLNGLISSVLGMKLPGPGTIFIEQKLRFLLPAYIGDTIKALVKVTDKTDKRVFLRCECWNQENKLICEGELEVSVPKKEVK